MTTYYATVVLQTEADTDGEAEAQSDLAVAACQQALEPLGGWAWRDGTPEEEA